MLNGDDALRDPDIDHLKQFFQWLVDNNRRGPQQTITLLHYFRVLKMAYTSLTRKQLDDTLVEDVNNASCTARVRFLKADSFLTSTLSTTLRASKKTRRDRNPSPLAKTSSRCSTTITHAIRTDMKMNASEFSKRF
jgi:hypothetical protein